MKPYRQLYKNPRLKSYFLFLIFFYFVMNLAKALHVLWFDENKELANFGLSYSAMALAGALSFAYSSILLKTFRRNPLLIPLLLYGVGIGLRIFTHSPWVAVASGCLAGVGASTALNAFRTFLADESQHAHFDLVLSHKNVLQQSASSLGTAAIGVVLALFLVTGTPYEAALIACAIAMFLLFLLWPSSLRPCETAEPTYFASWKLIFSNHSATTIALIGFSTLTGLCISCTSPFLMVMLKHQGVSVSHVGLLVGSGVFIGAFTQTLITPKLKKEKYLGYFLASETLLALATILLTVSGISPVLIATIYITRLFVMSLSIFLQESLEYRLIPKPHASEVLGMMQSSFLLGDMLGGSVGGYMSEAYGIATTLRFGSALFAINGLLFVICVGYITQRKSNVDAN